MPCLAHRSLADTPAACSFKTLMICSSVNLPLRIVCLLGGEQNPNSKPGAFQGSRPQFPNSAKREPGNPVAPNSVMHEWIDDQLKLLAEQSMSTPQLFALTHHLCDLD